jgi:hypothetical protein
MAGARVVVFALIAPVLAVATVFAEACRGVASNDPPDPSQSPQAKAEPAPIASPAAAALSATAPTSTTSAGGPVAPPPQPMRPDEPPPADALAKEGAKDGGAHESAGQTATKDVPIYELAMALRVSDVAGPPKGVDLAASGAEVARKKSEPSLSVDLTPGHARAVLGQGFVLPDGTELRARADRYGYIAVAPDGESYRVAATGSLRAVMGEGLFDVAPTSVAEVTSRGEGTHRLGRATRRVEVATRAAKGAFELAKVPDVGDGGLLVCRMLLDLMGAAPSAKACTEGEVPVHVELRWSAQPDPPPDGRRRMAGALVFEAVSLERRADLAATSFLAPPPSARFVPSGDPPQGGHLFLARADLALLRAGAGSGEPPAAPKTDPAAAVLSLHNSSDELRYVFVDGLPLAWLAPGARLDVSGIPHPRAGIQWRTFLGDAIDPAEVVTLPALVDALPAPGMPVTSSDNPPP